MSKTKNDYNEFSNKEKSDNNEDFVLKLDKLKDKNSKPSEIGFKFNNGAYGVQSFSILDYGTSTPLDGENKSIIFDYQYVFYDNLSATQAPFLTGKNFESPKAILANGLGYIRGKDKNTWNKPTTDFDI